MTEEQIAIYQKAAELGTIPDELNPLFLFSLTHPQLLARLIAGELDAVELAKMQLRDRGLDYSGQWVGFKKEEPTRPAKKQSRKKGPKL